MTIIERAIILSLIMLVSSCDSIKPRTNMVTITSSEYQCDNKQALNTGHWWTDPIVQPKKPDEFILCGGNIPAAQGAGIGNDICVSVNIKSCQISPLSNPMSTTRQALQPVCLTNGQCYLFGGNTTEASTTTTSVDVLNLNNQTLKQNAIQLPEPRLCSASAAVSDTDLIITGGYGVKDSTGKGQILKSAVRLKSKTGKSIPLSMNHKRGAHSITPLPGGTFLILGGNGDDPSGGEIFDPKTDTFTAIEAKMSSGRKDHRVIVANNGKAYILGGTQGQAAPTNIEVYDPATQLFTDTGLKLSEGREDAAVVYIKEMNIIVAVGGELKGAAEPESSAIDVIDLNANKVYSSTLKTPRDEPTLVVKSIDVAKREIHLVALTGQKKENKIDEVSLPAEEIVIKL